MASIQPTHEFTYPLTWDITTLEVTVKTFPLFPDTVDVVWKLSGIGGSQEGTMTIPHEVVVEWGTDDSVLENYVISELNLIRTV